MRAWVLLAAGLPAVASAGSWEPGEMRPIAVEGAVHTVRVGTFGGEVAIALAGPDAITLLKPDGTVRAKAERKIADLAVEDLDTDGASELVVCGPDGLNVLRVGDDGFAEPISLSDAPCESVEALAGDLYASLVTLSGGEVKVWTPGGDGLVGADFAGPANPRVIATVGGRMAVLGDTVVTGPEPAPLEAEAGAVALGPDGDGWALGYGGDAPHLVLADGTLVPLPAAPKSVRRMALAGPDDLVVGLGGRSVALRVGDAPLAITELPVAIDVLGAGDLDGDGCADLVSVAGDGSEASVVLGVCGDAKALAIPVEGEPASGGDVTLGENWAQLEVRVGETVQRKVVDGVNGWTMFAHRSAPEGFSLTQAGVLSYRPTQAQVGLWRVAVLATDGTNERWTGIVLRVRPPEPGTEPPEPVAAAPVPKAEIVLEPEPHELKAPKFYTIRECLVGAGVAGGLSKNAQSSWSNVGLPDAVPSASPAVTMVCAGGGNKAGWFLGADSAPTFFYLARNGRANHVLAGTLGVEWRPGAVRIGPFVNAGLVVFGFGLRTVIVPFETKKGGVHGIETRLTGYPANLSGQVMLAYTWEFGGF